MSDIPVVDRVSVHSVSRDYTEKIITKFEVDIYGHSLPSCDSFAASAIRDFVTLTFKGLTLDVDGPAT